MANQPDDAELEAIRQQMRQPGTIAGEMFRQGGEASLTRKISAGEVYLALEVLKDALMRANARIEALEAHGVRFMGTWQRAHGYGRGSVVTHASSMWVALRDTVAGETPGREPTAWQLSAKGKST